MASMVGAGGDRNGERIGNRSNELSWAELSWAKVNGAGLSGSCGWRRRLPDPPCTRHLCIPSDVGQLGHAASTARGPVDRRGAADQTVLASVLLVTSLAVATRVSEGVLPRQRGEDPYPEVGQTLRSRSVTRSSRAAGSSDRRPHPVGDLRQLGHGPDRWLARGELGQLDPTAAARVLG